MKAKATYLINDYLPAEELEEPSNINWNEVNEFYRWQLIKRNKDYIQFYNSTRGDTELIRNALCFEMWKIEPLSDPKELFPCFSSAKYLYDNFIEVGEYSYQKINSGINGEEAFSLADDLSTSLIHLTTEAQISEKEDNRFLILAVDLEKPFTSENQKSLMQKIHSAKTKYNESEKSFSRKSVDEIEKNLFVFDYVKENRSFLRIEKEFLKRFNTTSDRSTLVKRHETIKKHIASPNQIKFDLNTINT